MRDVNFREVLKETPDLLMWRLRRRLGGFLHETLREVFLGDNAPSLNSNQKVMEVREI